MALLLLADLLFKTYFTSHKIAKIISGISKTSCFVHCTPTILDYAATMKDYYHLPLLR